MKHAIIAVTGTLAVLTMAACTSSPRTLPPGEYKKTEKSVNKYGTETSKETNTRVYYDEYGNKRAVQETETSRDPEGLFNKSTTKTKKTY